MGNLNVSVVYADATGQLFNETLTVPEHTTIDQAIAQSSFLEHYPEFTIDKLVVGVYSIRKTLDDALHEQDRIEIYRPLLIDPKDRRRQTVDQKRSAKKWRQELKIKKTKP